MKPYYETEHGTIYQGNALEVLQALPDESVHCCVTSPPYWGLRDYGVDGQLGLEKTPEEYVAKMVWIFKEVKRVLRNDGTLWLNMGDSYAGYWGNKYAHKPFGEDRTPDETTPPHKQSPDFKNSSFKPKDLIGLPWRIAFALQADGWYLRSDIIWHKPNPVPESVTDRPTKAHEYIFLLSKNQKYYYDADAIREPHKEPERGRAGTLTGGHRQPGFEKEKYITKWKLENDNKRQYNPAGRNRRTVWTIATQPMPEAHFATFPEKLIEPCILAGTSEKGCCVECGAPWERVVEKTDKGFADRTFRSEHKTETDWNTNATGATTLAKIIESKTIGWQPTCKCNWQGDWEKTQPCTVLDPFIGAGTTAIVSYKHNRKFIGIDLSETYLKDIAIPKIERETQQLKLFQNN